MQVTQPVLSGTNLLSLVYLYGLDLVVGHDEDSLLVPLALLLLLTSTHYQQPLLLGLAAVVLPQPLLLVTGLDMLVENALTKPQKIIF